MFRRIRKLFCLHAYEYEIGANNQLIRECRKCGAFH